MKKIFGAINKSEEQDDGTLKVWGIASTDAMDSDGEVITAEAMKSAIPDYMKFGAVREMHGNVAAGTALEISVGEDGVTNFCALIVDPVAVKKVQTGTYKGFSIGGKVLKRDINNQNKITEIKLVEVSVVDRPANPEAVFTMYKCESVDNEQVIEDNKEKGENMSDVKKDEVSDPVIPEQTDIKKNLSDVAWLANLVQELHWLQECMEYEKSWEQDESKIPTELRSILKMLGDLLVSAVKEETDELNAEKSEKSEDLNKSEKLSDDIVRQIFELASKLHPQDITKSESNEDLLKFETIKSDLEKSNKLNEELSKRVKELEDMPAVPKAVLHTPEKEADLGKSSPAEVLVKQPGSNEIDEVATAIFKAQQNGKFVKM